MKFLFLFIVLAIVPSARADISDSGNLSIGGGGTLAGSLAVTGTAANFILGTASATLNGVPYLLPGAQGDAGDVLTNDGAGILSWMAGGGGAGAITTSTVLGGAFSGFLPNPTLVPGFGSQGVSFISYSGVNSNPTGMTSCGGYLWTSNQGNDAVSEINAAGTVLATYTGTGAAPAAIACDGTNVWTSNVDDNSISMITPSGSVTNYSLDGSQCDYPGGIAYDDSGSMWATCLLTNSMVKISSTGGFNYYSGTCSQPNGIALDLSGNMWVTCNNDASVAKVTSSGSITIYSGTLTEPVGIALDLSGNMWTADAVGQGASMITPSGVITNYSGAGAGAYPNSIVSDGMGNMVMSNGGNDTISVVTSTGSISNYGSTGDYPSAIILFGGNLWTADYDGDSVTQVVYPTVFAGPVVGGTTALGDLGGTYPWNIQVSSSSNPSGFQATYGVVTTTVTIGGGGHSWYYCSGGTNDGMLARGNGNSGACPSGTWTILPVNSN